jgi:ATP-binding cassette, subfamily C, bacterial
MSTAPDAPPALPVAGAAEARHAALRLLAGQGRGSLALTGALNALAAAAGLGTPWLLGRIVDSVQAHQPVGVIDRLALGILGFALGQLLLARFASYATHRQAERVLARIRDEFVDRTLTIPTSVIERAGTGDLMARSTGDIAAIGSTLRDAGPQVVASGIQVLFILAAIFLVTPLLGLCGVAGLAGIGIATRWYMRRARDAYLAEGAANSVLAEVMSSTAAGARTVEALSLQQRRRDACQEAIEVSRQARMRTLGLRSVLFGCVDAAYVVPIAGVLLIGFVLTGRGVVPLGAVAAAVAYLWQLVGPMDAILACVDLLQQGSASFSRVEGLSQALTPRVTSALAPADQTITVEDVRYAYQPGRDVLHGIDLVVRPGERLAVVGESGAGKTTLGRLLAGVDAPGSGRVAVGGVPLANLDAEQLRNQVIIVSQEQHVFLATVRDNLLIAAPGADDAELRRALAIVDASWFEELPDGLDTELGAGGRRLDAAQAQQLALARVVLADPHTLVLDEATALLDPATARHTERSLAAVLPDRTVIAIAHRLHTAQDADRIAVLHDGRLAELGSHDELLAKDGAYGSLWRSWHGARPPAR